MQFTITMNGKAIKFCSYYSINNCTAMSMFVWTPMHKFNAASTHIKHIHNQCIIHLAVFVGKLIPVDNFFYVFCNRECFFICLIHAIVVQAV